VGCHIALKALKPAWLPEDGNWPVWPRHIDYATDALAEFCEAHGLRRIEFNDLRASLATEGYKRGMTPAQESRIAGHSTAVAEKHYLEYEATEARALLPPDPLTEVDEDEPDDGSAEAAVG
jgi:hypothetical protein